MICILSIMLFSLIQIYQFRYELSLIINSYYIKEFKVGWR
ncbi:hypothetical protein HMPREF0105_0670 [Bacteroides sp. 3_1_33FAA]|uniref:Uncharacterized protein n=1 Tax=Phocaeicola dorei DSM 17855 TaxID=483217 RepID=B6W3K6_9BACT|nr:hypothetical protein BACDOR_03897 [Phocaeicola dorei DSM 17855]EEZ23287.1 hypothetical protein HMPREF0105_0670 [Bacteroides sp. 3_1_33FAA]